MIRWDLQRRKRRALVLLLLCAGGALGHSQRLPPRIILYPEEDNSDGRANFAEMQSALEERRLRQRWDVELRFAPVDLERPNLRVAAESLRDSDVAAVLAGSLSIAVEARRAFDSVPVIFASQLDPVHAGLVASYREPGRNMTGLTWFAPLDLKRIELLRLAFPAIRAIGYTVDDGWAGTMDIDATVRAAREKFGVLLRPIMAESIDRFVEGLHANRLNCDGWLVPYTNVPAVHPERVVDAVAATGKPAIFGHGLLTRMGGLMSYEAELDGFVEKWSAMLEAVLAGVAPGSIPVERPQTFRLLLNLATAKRQGLQFPRTLLVRAHEVLR
jgi:putative ABC transport system substrate-binding protein